MRLLKQTHKKRKLQQSRNQFIQYEISTYTHKEEFAFFCNIKYGYMFIKRYKKYTSKLYNIFNWFRNCIIAHPLKICKIFLVNHCRDAGGASPSPTNIATIPGKRIKIFIAAAVTNRFCKSVVTLPSEAWQGGIMGCGQLFKATLLQITPAVSNSKIQFFLRRTVEVPQGSLSCPSGNSPPRRSLQILSVNIIIQNNPRFR